MRLRPIPLPDHSMCGRQFFLLLLDRYWHSARSTSRSFSPEPTHRLSCSLRYHRLHFGEYIWTRLFRSVQYGSLPV
uniref:Uncharacterized protein n=2 Tax=Picea TaxID=3328 RepID=A0A101M5H9_PICGL|nr:hypothetical protein ABT39_MTgene1096 [Picea glauca]QHR89969.1 hypothetical protein Q903MT_gene3991 [Picea sitchensis]